LVAVCICVIWQGCIACLRPDRAFITYEFSQTNMSSKEEGAQNKVSVSTKKDFSAGHPWVLKDGVVFTLPSWFPSRGRILCKTDTVIRNHQSYRKDREGDQSFDMVGPQSARLLQQGGIPPLTREVVEQDHLCCYITITCDGLQFQIPIAHLLVGIQCVVQEGGTSSHPMPFVYH
jgi:hypothetical protein